MEERCKECMHMDYYCDMSTGEVTPFCIIQEQVNDGEINYDEVSILYNIPKWCPKYN